MSDLKLTAKKTPYSSVVGGGLTLVDYKGRVRFNVMICGSDNGITKEQDAAISEILMKGFEPSTPDQPQEGMPDAVTHLDRLISEINAVIADKKAKHWKVAIGDDLVAILAFLCDEQDRRTRADTVETVSVAELDVDHGADPQGGVGHYEIGYSAGYNQAINDIAAKYPNGVRIVE